MKNHATLTSKGQITVPLAVRNRLGLVEGDRIEFINEGGNTVIKPLRGEVNPFAKFSGVLGTFGSGIPEINAWMNELRGESDENSR